MITGDGAEDVPGIVGSEPAPSPRSDLQQRARDAARAADAYDEAQDVEARLIYLMTKDMTDGG